MIKAVINVTAPRQQVFSILSDYPNYKHWVPGCERCNVTSASGNTSDTEITISSMKRIELGVRFEAQPGHALIFRMTKGKDLKAYSGTYRLMDSTDGTGTVVIAELEIDVGMMVPKFMVDKMTRKMMDDTGVALRKYIASAPAPARAAAPAARPAAAAKRRRARKILRITKTAAGYNVWLMGETFAVQNPGA
ncbi:MAG: SRPBCC family protein [Acidobacteria bacterium]|nr:SRPBCC family protein [Acidobacteriota bacterium]